VKPELDQLFMIAFSDRLNAGYYCYDERTSHSKEEKNSKESGALEHKMDAEE
jgi:hypothetical protein